MKYKTTAIYIYSISFLMLLSSCTHLQKGAPIEQYSPVEGAVGDVVNLDQQWSVDTQQAFYFTSQGSRIMPYQWYLYLEQHNSDTYFRDNAHMESLRYIPAAKNRWNPDGLAVGFAKDIDRNTNEQWVGFNCSACHTAQIHFNGKGIRIDGGPTLADFERFNTALVSAMSATYQSQDKYRRFANNVLGSNHSANQSVALRQALLMQTEVLAQRNQINHPDPQQPHYGYGRVDAIGAIFNQILSTFNDVPNNGMASNAPVSYPFLWGTHQSDVVQWTGFAPNGPASVGALIRNGGEVLGVYGQLRIPESQSINHYQSSLAIKNLGELEKWVAELRSPIWPADIFPPINPVKASKGKQHYQQYCVRCHQVMTRADQGQKYNAVLTPLKEIGTDPQEIKNMLKLRPAGLFNGRKEFVLAGDKIPAKTIGLAPLVNAVVGSLLEHPLKAAEAALIEYEGGLIAKTPSDGLTDSDTTKPTTLAPSLKQSLTEFQKRYTETTVSNNNTADPAVYKARPLTGIWATAPYLHNGSVPTLYELLLSADQRARLFYVGSREFDPVNVGFVSTKTLTDTTAFKFDTELIGNSNRGHEYGVNEMDQQEKRELLEYLKTL